MSDEIRINASIQCNNGTYKQPQLGGAFTVDQTTAGGGNPGIVELAVAEEDISFGDITPLWVFIKNLDATDNIKFGPKDTTMKLLGQLGPGEWCIIPLAAGVTLRMCASANTPLAQIVGFDT